LRSCCRFEATIPASGAPVGRGRYSAAAVVIIMRLIPVVVVAAAAAAAASGA